jgi:hypothetical protein
MSIHLADNVSSSGNSYTMYNDERDYRAQFLSEVEPVVCVRMMKLKIRLETEEWVYEEHEMI